MPYAKNLTRSWQQTMFTDNYDSDGNARFHGQGITWMYYLSNWYSDIFKMLHSLLHSYYVRQSVSSRTNAKAWRLYWSTLKKLSIGSHMTEVFRKLATLQIHMECWMVLRDWHRDFSNVVKWNGTSTREHYKEVSSPHMHTRWRQRRTTRLPSPTYRGHHRNCVLCHPDMCRWCSSH